MIHEMKLRPQYYEYILNGTKRIELRLNDEKRSKIRIGDTIIFKKEPELTNSFKAEVVDLLYYSSFASLFGDYPVEVLADKSVTKKELLETLETFYTKSNQEKYGVVGIKIKLLS